MNFNSITHLHLFACINTMLLHSKHYAAATNIKILDVGCGKGIMLSAFVRELRSMHRKIHFEFYGLDVDDSSVQLEGYFTGTIKILQEVDQKINWTQNLKLICSTRAWPFDNEYFDFIVSNQVSEHVSNHSYLFSEIRRTLKPEGCSIHLFPSKHMIYKPHLFIPFVNRFKSWSTTYNWIKLFSYLGFGIYRSHLKTGLDKDIHGFSERHADYLTFQVNYLTLKELSLIAKRHRLKVSYDFTFKFYSQKLQSMFKLSNSPTYKAASINSFSNAIGTFFYRYVNNVTMVIRKNDTY